MRRLALVTLAACSAPAPLPPLAPPTIPATAGSATALPVPAAPPAAAALPVAPTPSAPARAAGYDLPPKDILDVLHAPTPPSPYVNPTGDTILLVSSVNYLPMARDRRAVPEARRRAGRAAHAPQARHAGRLRRQLVRARALARAHRERGRAARRAAGRRLRRVDDLVARRQALRVSQNTAGDAVELWVGRRDDRHRASRRRPQAQPDARHEHDRSGWPTARR